tara:strand:+ start:575 stop:850 length:276 start_codon:yes stop_codon:yes gene_type:complete
MPRTGSIKDPIKVTLYMPQKTVILGKDYAKNIGSSLSQVVTDLVEGVAGESVPMTIEVDRKTYKKLEKKASNKETSVASLIPKMINESLRG